MIKSIVIDKDGLDTEGQSKYDLRVYEGKLLVHQVKFVDPEFAVFYAENYMLNVWNSIIFPATYTMH